TQRTPGLSTNPWTRRCWACTTTMTSSNIPWISAPSRGRWMSVSTETPSSSALMSDSCSPTATSTTHLIMMWSPWHENCSPLLWPDCQT
uniref:Uncharacterized protein n=1 Tax=Cyprinus carpio TaxID=7962 RepID=A0A8C1WPY7_CYPCA